jgi:hypothetical protein
MPPDDNIPPPDASYYEVLTAAVNDVSENGYDSQERIDYWSKRLKEASEKMLLSADQMYDYIRSSFNAIYDRLVNRAALIKYHPGVSKYTLERIKPHLHQELNRRIMASADLIRLNKSVMVQKTLQRFQGWATSVPSGGTTEPKKRKEKKQIYKAMRSLPFEERRVLIDQAAKLTSSINNIVARDGGAIAVKWNSKWRQVNYNYRHSHKERDGKIYMLKDNWAQKNGLVVPGPAGYYEDITAFGEEVYCRCTGSYIYNLRSLPETMLTKKGREELEKARKIIASA